MGRSEHYVLPQGIEIRRDEIQGERLVIRQMRKTTRWRGKDWPTTCIRWEGLHRFQWGAVEQIVEQSQICDAGPVGISAVASPPVAATREERAAGQERIRQAAGQSLGNAENWGRLKKILVRAADKDD